MHKVVIDTNLLINGSVDDYNYANRIIDAVIEGKVAAYANPPTLRENQFISGLKISDTDYKKKLQFFFGRVHRVPVLDSGLDVVTDPEDNKLIESAVAARADFVVSSDHHLLELKEYQGVKVMTPEAFWTFYEEESAGAWKQWLNQFMR